MTTTRDRTVLTRGLAVLLAAVLALALYIPMSPAAAQVDLLDPDDVCVVPAPPAPYADRGKISRTHVGSVDCTFELEVSRGRMRDGERFFDPDGTTRRDMMATFIVQTLEASGYELPPATEQGFRDIRGNTHEDNINRLAAAGIVNGTTDTTFSPQRPVQRDQMASFLLQAVSFAFDGTNFEAQSAPGFVDVLASNVHRDNINAAFDILGLVQGRSDTMYHPNRATPREQMATFLTRLVDLTYNK